jgi:Permuted papain-like amidase enzyme, YaeF/YiiX, C92 family
MMRFAIQAVAALAAVVGLGLTLAPAEDLPPLKTGDIVFQKTTTSASDAIMLASGTEYTHVGIVEIDKSGHPIVIEAVGPVQTVPLEKWIGKGNGDRITIKRIKGLDEAQARDAIASARRYLGLPYDHYFYETRDQIYCSELVYAAFKDGPGITVGREEKVRDLNIDTDAAQKLIAQRWKSHPLCKAKGAKSFKACYAHILEQTLVTPASIARDPQMELVYTSFGAGAE